MIKTKIIVVDRTKASFLKEGERFYLERLRAYTRMEWREVKPVRIKKGTPTEKALSIEGETIAKGLLSRDYIFALDRMGKAYGSEKLANRIEQLSQTHSSLAFVIGGPLGLSKTILSRADEILSLSRLTLTHEMSRLLLLEQLYRAFTIINHEKYHK
jgi:23S rRNA (pseudouridine1915-N3)-methyltransferase